MSKAQVTTQVTAADGAAVPVPVVDYSREKGPWPVKFAVPKDQAERWLQHLQGECGARGWGVSSSCAMTSAENSGSITVRAGATVPCSELIIVWRRTRRGPLRVCACTGGTPQMTFDAAREFIKRVDERTRSNEVKKFYSRGILCYEGLPWRGELWLDENLRLGPPSRQYEQALLGPRVVLVDAEVEAVDAHDAGCVFDLKLRELAVFLSVVMRTAVEAAQSPRLAWTWDASPDGHVNCEHRNIGYLELEPSQGMPTRGAGTPVPLRPVRRPDLTLYGINCTLQQQALPADVGDLWKAFASLPDDVRRRFLQAANPYRRGLSLQRDDRTLGAALMVVACEALKLPGAAYDGHNILGVVKALLGESCAQALLDMVPHPLAVRNPHLHRGEFKGDEFTKLAFLSSYQDPSFDQGCRVLAVVTPAAIVEWLRRGGNYALPPRRRGNATGWGWVLLCAALLAAGLILGWGLRAFAG